MINGKQIAMENRKTDDFIKKKTENVFLHIFFVYQNYQGNVIT